jgi:hypothetical protein
VLMREEVVLARTDQGDGLTRVMVEYVSEKMILGRVLQRKSSLAGAAEYDRSTDFPSFGATIAPKPTTITAVKRARESWGSHELSWCFDCRCLRDVVSLVWLYLLVSESGDRRWVPILPSRANTISGAFYSARDIDSVDVRSASCNDRTGNRLTNPLPSACGPGCTNIISSCTICMFAL